MELYHHPERRIGLFMLIFYRHLGEGEWEMGYIKVLEDVVLHCHRQEYQ